MPATRAECVRLVIPCNAKYLAVARLTVAAVAAHTALTIDDIEDAKVAISEACTNAMQHAFAMEGEEGQPSIEIGIATEGNLLRVEVTDQGRGFDPKRVARVEQPLGGEREGGLGLYLMEQLMDKVEVESAPGSGTKVTMIKRASK